MKRGDLRFRSAARRERFARCTGENRGRMSGSRKPTGAYEARRLVFPLGGAPGTVRAVYRREPRTGEWKHRRESMKYLRFCSATLRNGRACDGARRYADRSAGASECRGGIERRCADLRVSARRRAGNSSRGVSKASADGRVEAGNRRERMKRGRLCFYSATPRNGRACDGARRYAGRSAGASECRGGIERRCADLRVPARRRAGNSSRGVPKGTTDGRVEASTREYEVLAFPLGGALERPYLRRRTPVRWPKRWRVGTSRRY